MSSVVKGASYTGRCLCQQVLYRASGVPQSLCFCHCESCRRAVGAPFVAWATFGRSGFELLQGELTEVRTSPAVTRGFCNRCGTSISYSHDARSAEIDVTLVTLDAAATLSPERHIWVQDKPAWVEIHDGLPQFDAGSGG